MKYPGDRSLPDRLLPNQPDALRSPSELMRLAPPQDQASAAFLGKVPPDGDAPRLLVTCCDLLCPEAKAVVVGSTINSTIAPSRSAMEVTSFQNALALVRCCPSPPDQRLLVLLQRSGPPNPLFSLENTQLPVARNQQRSLLLFTTTLIVLFTQPHHHSQWIPCQFAYRPVPI